MGAGQSTHGYAPRYGPGYPQESGLTVHFRNRNRNRNGANAAAAAPASTYMGGGRRRASRKASRKSRRKSRRTRKH